MLVRPGLFMTPIRPSPGAATPPEPVDDAMLLEDGGQMLGEDGGVLLLEAAGADPDPDPPGEALLTEVGAEIHTEAGDPIAQES